jgi:hypothetical protein
VPYEVQATPLAQGQIAGLRGRNRAAFDTFTADLARRGCAAADYRVTGEILERLCVRHLRGQWRAVVCFDREDVAWVLLVGEHVGDPDRNVYDLLYRLVGTAPEPDEKRRKPPCCDDESEPPVVEDETVDTLVRRTREVLGRGRR